MISNLDDFLEANNLTGEPNRTYFMFDQWIPVTYEMRLPLHSFFPDDPDDKPLGLPDTVESTCVSGFNTFAVVNPELKENEYIDVSDAMARDDNFLNYYFSLVKFPVYTQTQIDESLPKDVFMDDVNADYFK